MYFSPFSRVPVTRLGSLGRGSASSEAVTSGGTAVAASGRSDEGSFTPCGPGAGGTSMQPATRAATSPGRTGRTMTARILTVLARDARERGCVPSRVAIEKWRILLVGCLTTNRPSTKTDAGGMRHGEAYQ